VQKRPSDSVGGGKMQRRPRPLGAAQPQGELAPVRQAEDMVWVDISNSNTSKEEVNTSDSSASEEQEGVR